MYSGYSKEIQDSISSTIVNVSNSLIDNSTLIGLFFTLPFVLLICYIIGIKYSSKRMHYVVWGTFLVLCLSEVLLLTVLSPILSDYIENLSEWGVFRFLFLVIFTGVMQVPAFFMIMDNIRLYNESDFSLSMGFWAFGIGLVLSILLGLIWGEIPFSISILLTILTQPAQAVYIFIMVLKKNNIFIALLAAATYLIGFMLTIASAIICAIAIFILKVIAWFLSGLSDNDKNDKRNSNVYYNY